MDIEVNEDERELAGAEDLNAMGVRLAKAGRLEEALGKFREALEIDPQFPPAHYNLGVALAESGQSEAALDSFRTALRGRPDYAEAHCGIGNALAAQCRHAQAADSYRRALDCRPDHFGSLNGLGLSLGAMRRHDEAAIILRQALRLRPEDPSIHNNLGLALNDAGRYAEAEAAFCDAMRLDPAYAEAHANLGNTYKEQGRVAEALACYDLAVWLRSESATARWNRSLALLQAGDFARGWEEYEWRWARKGAGRREWERPMWDGSPLNSRTILLHMEQGLGDTLMFIRYAALVKQSGGTVIAEYPAPLARILPTCKSIDQWVAEGDPQPEFHVHAPIMSLPRLLGTTLETVPADIPYLFADTRRVTHWRGILADMSPGLKVGIAWQGNPHHAWDVHRSVPLAAFAPLARVPGVQLISLQRGPGTEQLDTIIEKTTGTSARLPVHELLDRSLPDAESVMESTSLISALDLVVSVDTATAHLAGALGAPSWVLLSTLVDWRWMLGREDTPWYPGMRLFRQARRGDWHPVFARIAEALADRAAILSSGVHHISH